jgi:hypothetical protein
MKMKNKEYRKEVAKIIYLYDELELTKKQIATLMWQKFGGDFNYHYFKVVRLID